MTLVCPKCQAAMRTYERNGVHLDQCTECRGLFLDRGELERLVDAEAAYYGDRPSSPSAVPSHPAPPQHAGQQPSYQQPSYQQPSYQQPSYQQPSYQQPGYGASAQAGHGGASAASSSSASSSDLGRLASEVLKQVSSARSSSHSSSGYGTPKRKKSFLDQLLG